MSRLALITGVLLVVLGGVCLGAGALPHVFEVPLALGVALVALGIVATRPALRMHAMHAAMLVGLGGIGLGLWRLARSLPGRVPPPVSQVGLLSGGATAALCLVFLILGVKSFIDARRSTKPAAQPS